MRFPNKGQFAFDSLKLGIATVPFNNLRIKNLTADCSPARCPKKITADLPWLMYFWISQPPMVLPSNAADILSAVCLSIREDSNTKTANTALKQISSNAESRLITGSVSVSPMLITSQNAIASWCSTLRSSFPGHLNGDLNF